MTHLYHCPLNNVQVNVSILLYISIIYFLQAFLTLCIEFMKKRQ